MFQHFIHNFIFENIKTEPKKGMNFLGMPALTEWPKIKIKMHDVCSGRFRQKVTKISSIIQ